MQHEKKQYAFKSSLGNEDMWICLMNGTIETKINE